MRTGELGYWWRSLGGPTAPARRWRVPLRGGRRDRRAPASRGCGPPTTSSARSRRCEIVVLEREIAGFGASGRNGGWVSGVLLRSRRAPTNARGRAAERYAALQRAMFDTVDEVGARARRARDRRRLRQGRHRSRVALGAAQAARLREELARRPRARPRRGGPARADAPTSSRGACASRVPRGATFSPHVARVHPAQAAARPRRRASSALGVRDPRVTRPSARSARTRRSLAAGSVRARWVVRATEGYTASLRGPAARARADEQLDDRHRAARRPAAGSRSAGQGARSSATARTCTSTCSAPTTGASRSAAAASPTASARAPTARATPRRRRSRACARSSRAMFPAAAGVALAHAWSGVLGVSARLVRVGRRRPRHRARVGRRLRRRGRRGVEPRRAHAARPDARRAEPRSPRCRGSGAARGAGSPSRCAGARSTASTRSTAAPTASSSAPGAPRGSARLVDPASGRV